MSSFSILGVDTSKTRGTVMRTEVAASFSYKKFSRAPEPERESFLFLTDMCQGQEIAQSQFSDVWSSQASQESPLLSFL